MSHLELIISLGIGIAYIIVAVILDMTKVINLSKLADKGVKYQILLSSPVLLSMLYIVARLYIIPMIKFYLDK